jgi:hypothetical protein
MDTFPLKLSFRRLRSQVSIELGSNPAIKDLHLVSKFGVTLSLMIILADSKKNCAVAIEPKLVCQSCPGSIIIINQISSRFTISSLVTASIKGFSITSIQTLTCKIPYSIKLILNPTTTLALIIISHRKTLKTLWLLSTQILLTVHISIQWSINTSRTSRTTLTKKYLQRKLPLINTIRQ